LGIQGWSQVAALAGTILSPTRILDEVVPSGRLTLLFAERLFPRPEQKEDRDRFLHTALERLPSDTDLTEADRFYYEGRVLALLGNREEARDRFVTALGLDPVRADWRKDYVGWLIAWGEADEAHKEALVGVSLAPDDADAKAALKQSTDAVARGSDSSSASARLP
jgi:tetratricopeptide (TPR) repeat protein